MKKRVFVILVFCLFFSFAIGVSCSFAAAKYTIKMYSVAPPYSPVNQAVSKLNEQLVKDSKGEVEIQLFGAGQLGPESAGLNQLQMGAVQAGSITGVALSVIEPKANVFNLPFLFKDYADIEKFVNSPAAEELAATLDKRGFKLLGITSYGFFTTISKKGFLANPADFKGVKIRVYPTPILVDLYKIIGASPTPVAYTEIYTALQQGLIDGTDGTLDSANASKQYEVCKYLTLTDHIHGWFFYLVNKKWYEGLPKNIQTMLADGFKKCGKVGRELSDKNDEELLEKFKKEKVQVKKLNEKEKEVLKKATYGIHEKYGSQIGADFLESVYKTVNFQKP